MQDEANPSQWKTIEEDDLSAILKKKQTMTVGQSESDQVEARGRVPGALGSACQRPLSLVCPK